MPKRDLAAFLVPQNAISIAPAHSSTKADRSVVSIRSGGTRGTTTVSLPKYGNLQVSVGSEIKSVIRPDADNFPRGFASGVSRGDFGGFQCTSRGDARLLALPPVASSSSNNSSRGVGASSADATTATPDVSAIGAGNSHGGVTLRDVWRFGMRAKAPLLTEIDPAAIGRPYRPAADGGSNNNNNNNGNVEGGGEGAADDKLKQQKQASATEKVRIVRVQPEWLGRGMVQPPQAEVVEVDRAVLDDDAARLMNPAQRRALMETQRLAREGLVALREVQAARTKLSRTCQKLYPHGALGCVDGPYSAAPDAHAYAELATTLQAEGRKVGRKGKKEAPAYAVPAGANQSTSTTTYSATRHDTGAVILNISKHGERLAGDDGLQPHKKSGIAVRNVACRPKDTIARFLSGESSAQ